MLLHPLSYVVVEYRPRQLAVPEKVAASIAPNDPGVYRQLDAGQGAKYACPLVPKRVNNSLILELL